MGGYMDKHDWEFAARRQKNRADEAERRLEDCQHGINLLINGSMEWFLVQKTPNGAEHRFGIGVVKNATTTDPLVPAIKKRQTENRPVVSWLTCWDAGDGRVARYVSAYSIDGLKRMPAQWAEEDAENKDHLVDLLRQAAELVDGALHEYLKRRKIPDA